MFLMDKLFKPPPFPPLQISDPDCSPVFRGPGRGAGFPGRQGAVGQDAGPGPRGQEEDVGARMGGTTEGEREGQVAEALDRSTSG